MPSKLDPFKPKIDQWPASDAGLQAARIHQDLELPLYGFHMVPGHSRAFVGLVGSQDLVTFWACDRVYHPEAPASAHHYGFKLRLCRPYRPQTKGKVESDLSYVRGRLLRNMASATMSRQTASGRAGTQTSPVGAGVGETVELRLGAEEIEVHSILTGERYCRHPRRRDRIALPDPVERSVSLAGVLAELPDVEVHHRPLDAYAPACVASASCSALRGARPRRYHGLC